MTPEEYDSWVGTVMTGFAEMSTSDNPALLLAASESRTFMGMPIEDTLMVTAFLNGDPDIEMAVNRLLLDGPPRKVAAIATHALWSPRPEEPTTDAWLACVVAARKTAVFGIKRWAEDDLWHRLDPRDAPWLALSTAAGLRAALEDGEPMVMKQAHDRRLFNSVDEAQPPVGEDGRL